MATTVIKKQKNQMMEKISKLRTKESPYRNIAGIFKGKIIEAQGDIYNLSL
jgi:hypothetical protein